MLTARVSPACKRLAEDSAQRNRSVGSCCACNHLGRCVNCGGSDFISAAFERSAPALPPQLWPAPEVFSLVEEPRNSAPNAWQSNVTPPPASSSYPQLAMSQLPPSPPPVFPSSQGAQQ